MKKLFRKEILKTGKWIHPQAPNGVLEISKDYLTKLKDNFEKYRFAPVTRGHPTLKEMEKDTSLIINKNIDGLELDGDSLYAKMQVDEAELDKYNDVSASIQNDYMDKETGKQVGPVLRHVAMTVSPYLKNLSPFTALQDEGMMAINLSDINNMAVDKELEETTNEVTENVEEISEKTAETTETEEVKEEVVEEGKEPEVEEKTEEEEKEETVDASDTVVNAQQKIVELEERIEKQEREILLRDAESSYDTLLHDGKIVPAQKEVFIELSTLSTDTIELSDGSKKGVSQLVAKLFELGPKVVEFGESGVDSEALDGEDVEIPAKLRTELRAKHTELSDDEFDEWIAKHKKTILEANKKYSK